MIVPFGYDLTPEPGNMVGPTIQGMDDLIAQGSRAPTGTRNKNEVVSTMNPSPRVVAIPLFDPPYYEDGKHNGRGASLQRGELPGVLHRGDAGQRGQGTHYPDSAASTKERATAQGRVELSPYAIRLVQ